MNNSLYSEEIQSFKDWSIEAFTKSLDWYNAHIETKHNRDKYFARAKGYWKIN